MRLLLVEDDPMVGQSARKALRLEGFTVDWARDGREAELAVDDAAPYDLVLLDLGLPRRAGLDLLKDWRARGRDVPVLITTARDAVADRVAGLNAGADDYLIKPYDLDELLARIHALLRRRAGRGEPVLTHGPLQVNPLTRQVRLRGEPVALSPREFALLQALLDRPGAVLSVAQLQERIYGWDDEVGSNTVEVYIHALRRKLGSGAVRNVRGVGYMIGGFDEPTAGGG
ncbi:MAG: response regulator [Burkholderiaceae bacterium]